jgi:hypothetical protein
VPSNYSAAAITECDRLVAVLSYQSLVQPKSNGEATLRNGSGCLRNSHVAFGVLGALAVDTRDVELRFHSPGLRHAYVTAITGVGLG